MTIKHLFTICVSAKIEEEDDEIEGEGGDGFEEDDCIFEARSFFKLIEIKNIKGSTSADVRAGLEIEFRTSIELGGVVMFTPLEQTKKYTLNRPG